MAKIWDQLFDQLGGSTYIASVFTGRGFVPLIRVHPPEADHLASSRQKAESPGHADSRISLRDGPAPSNLKPGLSRRWKSVFELKRNELCDLAEALRTLDCRAARDLDKRIIDCLAGREQERAWRAQGVLPPKGFIFRRCRRPACPFCHQGILRKAMSAAAEAFRTADNEYASLVTVRLSRTADITSVKDIVEETRGKLRDWRNKAALKEGPGWASWSGLQMLGYVELGAVCEADVQSLPPQLQAAILASPLRCQPVEGGDPVWLPHLHMMVRHDQVGRRDLSEMLARRFPGNGRVDVRAFYPSKCVDENAAAVAAYTLKRSKLTTFDAGIQEKWPMTWTVRYYLWLHTLHQSLRPLQVKIGPMKRSRVPAVREEGREERVIREKSAERRRLKEPVVRRPTPCQGCDEPVCRLRMSVAEAV